MKEVRGFAGMSVYYIRTRIPRFEFRPSLCPTERPLIWEFEDQLYLVPYSVIKNARRNIVDRQAHSDVYLDGDAVSDVRILLGQSVPLHLPASCMDILTEQDLEEDEQNSNSHSP